jgi:hypothetical protein
VSAPPLPGKANLHNALAMALGKRTQESDKVLIDTVCGLRREVAELRRQLDEAQAGPDLFGAFEQAAT